MLYNVVHIARLISIALLSILIPAPAYAQSHFGEWEITHDETQCAARKWTPESTLLIYTYEPGVGLAVVAANPNWKGRINKGSEYRMLLKFDAEKSSDKDLSFKIRAGSIQVPGEGIGYNGSISKVRKFFRQLARSESMNLIINGMLIERFDLTGSDEIVRSLLGCADTIQRKPSSDVKANVMNYAEDALAFRLVKLPERHELGDGRESFYLSATVTNRGRKTLLVPPVRIDVHDRQGALIYSTTVLAAKDRLNPSEEASIELNVNDVPKNAETVSLVFVRDRMDNPK